MEIREVFARNLRNARHARGLSQEALADEAGMDRTYISALERARYSATIDVVDRLAKALNVDPGALLQRSARQRKS
jgi:transcriptional regulator with XRE-family HTH domain